MKKENRRKKEKESFINKEKKKGCREGRGVGKKKNQVMLGVNSPMMNVIFMYIKRVPRNFSVKR